MLKELLQLDLEIDDFKKFDMQIYSSLKFMKDKPKEVESLGLNFTIVDDGKVADLKSNG